MKRTGEQAKSSSGKSLKRSLNKTTIMFAILFVIGIIGLFFVMLFVNKETRLVLQEETYQFSRKSRIEHKIGTSLTNSEMSTILVEDKKEANIDYTPMYAKNGGAIYLPESYIYFSTDDNSEWKIPEFMKLTQSLSNEVIQCTFNDEYYEIKHGFLIDSGNRNCIFLDTGEVVINNINKYPVSIFSFFSMEDDILRIYNLSSDEMISLEKVVDNDRITNVKFVSNSGYLIDLYKGSFIDAKGEYRVISASPTLLPSISER